MADNTELGAASGGDIIASDEIGGIKYQRIKLIHGADGVNAGDVSAANPLPVLHTGSLPAGTAAIGKLAANSGIDIGDVDVTSVIPGVAATSLGKAEDAAHASGDVGVMALAVRRATASADLSAGATNGDYEPMQVDAYGKLYTNSCIYTPLGDSAMDDTADASRVLIVDSTGSVINTAVDRLTDNIGVAHQTDIIMNDVTPLTPKFAPVSFNSAGNNTLIAAVSSKIIRITGGMLVAAGSVTLKLQSGAGGTDLTGAMTMAAGVPFPMAFDPTGHVQTASNTLLNAVLSGGVQVSGYLKYVEV